MSLPLPFHLSPIFSVCPLRHFICVGLFHHNSNSFSCHFHFLSIYPPSFLSVPFAISSAMVFSLIILIPFSDTSTSFSSIPDLFCLSPRPFHLRCFFHRGSDSFFCHFRFFSIYPPSFLSVPSAISSSLVFSIIILIPFHVTSTSFPSIPHLFCLSPPPFHLRWFYPS